MDIGLRRRLWRIDRKINEFLEGDLGWVRILSGLLITLALLFFAIVIQYLIDPQAGIYDWMANPVFSGIPFPILRGIGVIFSWTTLRFIALPTITFIIGLVVGAHYIQDLYNITSYSAAVRYLLASLFGISYPFLRIENGKMILNENEVNSLEAIGGPGYVLISPGNAVLFEHLQHPASVRGQGLHFISRFESIKEIVDLKDQHGYIEKTSAMSKDGIVVTVHDIHFRYRLWGGQRVAGNTGRIPENPYPYSIQAVRNMAYNRGMRSGTLVSWHQAVQSAFDGDILNYIRTNLLDAVTAPEGRKPDGTIKNPRRDIQLSLTSPAARIRFRNLGAELIWFDIGRFNFEDPEVEEQRISTWSAEWVGDAEVLLSFGEAQRQAYHELARAEAQAELLMSLVHSLHEAGLSGGLSGEPMRKMMMLKTAQVLESMSGVYEPNPNGA
jgi:hypothetical protein